MMNETNRDEVLWRYLGGNPPSPELAAEIASDAGLARRLAELALLECGLNDLADAGQETPATLRLKRSELTSREATTSDSNAKVAATIYCETPDLVRARYSRYVWGALAACLLGLIGGAIWSLSSKMEPFQVRFEARGENVTVRRGAETVQVTDSWLLRAGDVIRTGGESKATLRFENEATALTLSKDAELALIPTPGGKRLELTRGHLEAEVDKQPAGAPLVCVTPHVTITVLGTRFFVATDAETTRVVVKEGKVRVKDRATGATVELAAGQLAVAASQTPLQVEAFETAPPSLLPPGWLAHDVGSVGLPGSGTISNSVFTVKGSGADILGSTDGFHFVHELVSGDFEIHARVTGVENTYLWAKAGLMIRETLDADSKHAIVFVTPGNGVRFKWRNSTGGWTSTRIGADATAPYWVKLQRSGNIFTASQSSDGATWSVIGSSTITMTSTVRVGLAVTSAVNVTLCTATFDNVTVASDRITTPGRISNLMDSQRHDHSESLKITPIAATHDSAEIAASTLANGITASESPDQ